MVRKPKLTPSNDGYGSSYTVRIPLWPYLVTPLCVVAALPLTGLLHHFYGRGPGAGWTGVFLALAAVALVAFTGWASRPRGKVMQVMATGNALLSCLCIVPAVLDGPFTRGMIGVWLMGGLLMSVVVALYRIMRMARGDEAGGGVIRGELVELGDAVKQLKDARLSRPQITGAKVTTDVTMPPGRLFSEVADAKAAVASLHDVPVSAVRTVQDPDSARRGSLVLVPVDQLRNVKYAGASAPGASIAQPIRLGVREDGEPAELHLTGDPSVQRNAVGVMGVVGMSGSGKTEFLLNFCTEVLTRHDARLHIADARKGGQLPEFLRANAATSAIGLAAAEAVIEDMPAEIERRSKLLGAKGYKQWQEGCGIPFEVHVIFEAAAVVAGNSGVVDLAESVRSVGICLVLELQRATHDRFPTSARANVTTWAVLGVQRDDDAEAALSEETIAAGAAPWAWKNTKPGYFYMEAAGVDRVRWSEPCRSFEATDEQRQADVAAVRGGAQAAPEPAPDGVDAPEPERGAVDPEDPPDDVDPSQPIAVPAGMPRIPLGDTRPPMAPADARGLLLQHIADLSAAGHDVVRPAQLGGVLDATGLSGSWLYVELGALTKGEQPVLRRTDRGVYRILAPEPA